MTRALVFVIASSFALGLLASDATGQSKLPGTPARRLLETSWDSLASVPAAVAESLFNKPYKMIFIGDVAVVLDYGDVSLRAFDQRGVLTWSYTRRGQGPAELYGPGGFVVGSDGLGWLADRGNARAYAFAADGRLVHTVPLDFMAERAFPVNERELLVVPSLPGKMPVLVDRASGRQGREVAAGPLAGSSAPQARGDVQAVGVSGGGAAFAYSFGAVVAVIDGKQTVKEIVGPIGQPFPRPVRIDLGGGKYQIKPDPRTSSVASSINLVGGHLAVQSMSASSSKRNDVKVSLIDIYDLTSQTYVGTIEAPHKAEQVAIRGDVVALLRIEPEPALSFWRIRGAPWLARRR